MKEEMREYISSKKLLIGGIDQFWSMLLTSNFSLRERIIGESPIGRNMVVYWRTHPESNQTTFSEKSSLKEDLL